MRVTLIQAVRFVEVAFPEPGSRFGAYVIEHPVGAGGMAVVWKARHTALARTVALKIMREETVRADPAAVPRFMREARVAASVAHLGIGHVDDVGEADGQPYIAMEWIDGRTLSSRRHAEAQPGPVSRQEKIDMHAGIAEILAYSHGKGIVHRDLKPAN